MERKLTHLRRAGATFVLLLALVGAAPAYAGSAGGSGPSHHAGSSRSVHSAVVRDGGGGWGRRDGAVWLGALVGVVAFGLWGDAVVGIAILGVAAIGDAMAFLVRRVAARRRPQVVDSLDTRRIERAKLQHR